MSQKTFFAVALIAASFVGSVHAAAPTDSKIAGAETASAARVVGAKTRAEVIAELQRARASGEMQQWDTNSYARPTLSRLNDAKMQNAKLSRM